MMDTLSQWNIFKETLPHQQLPYSKKNWGHPNHSLCSYQGKLKPAIAYNLVNIFVPQNGIMLDPFAGVGTIPFEAALNGRMAYGIDISPLAYIVSSAKIGRVNKEEITYYIEHLESSIEDFGITGEYVLQQANFGFNKKLGDYYHPETFRELLILREYLLQNPPTTPSQFLVCASLLHILHGNRPYALSRRSHPIIPYAPQGDFEYKNVIEKLKEKVKRAVDAETSTTFHEGKVFQQDTLQHWNDEINNLDAIITSPPFFDSTKFSMANWIRLWFLGWDRETFKNEPSKYVDEKQKHSLDVYIPIFEQAKERLKTGGYFVLHLGKNDKCDMGVKLNKLAQKYFIHTDLFDESVVDCQKFGIRDIGGVTAHEYLVCY
ncbi:MAG: hypothetical protein MJZ64_08310 [Paludibacteraceae bacterium]|nr:hypothetical protein [Paludibacteraceae bacterium]